MDAAAIYAKHCRNTINAAHPLPPSTLNPRSAKPVPRTPKPTNRWEADRPTPFRELFAAMDDDAYGWGDSDNSLAFLPHETDQSDQLPYVPKKGWRTIKDRVSFECHETHVEMRVDGHLVFNVKNVISQADQTNTVVLMFRLSDARLVTKLVLKNPPKKYSRYSCAHLYKSFMKKSSTGVAAPSDTQLRPLGALEICVFDEHVMIVWKKPRKN
jgi:hypothetical protein